MASIKNDEHQHQSSTNDPKEVEEKLCQLMKDNLHTTANDPTEAGKQPHQADSSPPLDGPPTDSSSSPDNDNKTNEEVDEPRIQAKEATGLNNDPSPSPNNDNKTDKRADGEADESTTPAKDETKPADDELSQSSEDESNSPEPDPSETKADRLRRERRAELDDFIERDGKVLMPRHIWQLEQDFRRTDWQAYATDPSYRPPFATRLELSESEAEELQRQEREWCRSYEENMQCEDYCVTPDEEWLADLKAEQMSKDAELRHQEQEPSTKIRKGYEDDRNITAVAPNEAENSLASDQIRTDPLVPSKL